MQNTKKTLLRTCICGMLIGVAVVFCRWLGFPQNGIWRVEFSFLPIAIVAMLYGPLWAGASYGIADLIGAAIFTGVNPFITLVKVLTGVVMGVFFKGRKKIGYGRILVAFAIIGVALDFLAMTFIFHFGFGHTWEVAFVARGANALVNAAIRIPTLLLCDGRLTAYLEEQDL